MKRTLKIGALGLIGIGLLETPNAILHWIGFILVNTIGRLNGDGASTSEIARGSHGTMGYSVFSFHGLPSGYAAVFFILLGGLLVLVSQKILPESAQHRTRHSDPTQDRVKHSNLGGAAYSLSENNMSGSGPARDENAELRAQLNPGVALENGSASPIRQLEELPNNPAFPL
jgi:hypothetical protein